MPGAVPRTSTFSLNNATFPYTRALANKGVRQATADDAGLLEGVNTYDGHITCQPVADSQGRPHKSFEELIG
jgi:alanine dehydrogenase